LAVTGGLPLLLFFIAIIVVAFWQGLKQMAKSKSLLYLSLISSLAAWVISACFNPVPVPMYVFLALLISGLMLGSLNKKQINFLLPVKIIISLFAALVLILGLVSLVSEHLLGIAAAAYANGNYSQSFKLSRLAYTINPTNELFLIYKAGSEIYLGQNRQEIENDINKIIKLHPDQAEGYLSASNLYAALYSRTNRQQDLESAVTSLQNSLNIDPYFAERYGQLALYYYQLGNYRQAQVDAQKNLAMDNSTFSAWILLARLYQLQGKKQAVISALTEAFKLDPNIPQLKYLLYLAKTLPDIRQVPIQIQTRPPGI
jgi:tetratricopeptide (TPR) repeat protein